MANNVEMGTSSRAPFALELSTDKLHKVTDSASRFRDITKVEQKKEFELSKFFEDEGNQEIAVKVGLAVGALVLLIGTVIAANQLYNGQVSLGYDYDYYFNGYYYTYGWVESTMSLAPLGVLVGVAGGAGSLGLGAAAIFYNVEEERNKFGTDLSQRGAIESALYNITDKPFDDVFRMYFKNNGGIGPLVRSGIINEDQGVTMQRLFKERSEQEIAKGEYTRFGNGRDVQANPAKYPAYQAILQAQAKTQGEGEDLLFSIREQYAKPKD